MTFTATLTDVRPLVFPAADAELDLPGHVRAGSALRRWRERVVVVQDDVNALALLDETTGIMSALTLPAGADGRRTFGNALGNKARKMDLEACVVLPDGRLVALGSGSTPEREHVVVLTGDADVRVHDGRDFYAHLRSRTDFAGSELNIEGAAITQGVLKLLQRGNGAPKHGLEPQNSIGDLNLDGFVAWLDGGKPPALEAVLPVELGQLGGVRLGFTDAAVVPDGRLVFLAGAEASPDTFHDGTVLGCRFGILDGHAIHMTDIVDVAGVLAPLKLEGIDWRAARDPGVWEFTVVADMDAPDSPAVLGTLHVVWQ